MTPIRLAFSDFPGPFNPRRILKLLKQRFPVQIEQEYPDYVIYSVFGHDFTRYGNAVRIFFTGENVIPDFNLCDYAFGYHWIEFSDRYFRCPNYRFYDQYKELTTRGASAIQGEALDHAKPRFCNFIYTKSNGHPFRDEFFHRLNSRKRVDSAGRHLRNVDDDIGPAYHGDWTIPKVEYQKQFRFSIAFENSSSPGYTTEKIVHALAADTVPIYWGNPDIGREFNTRRFINCHEYESPDAVIERVLELEQDRDAFRCVLTEPFFPPDNQVGNLTDEAVLDRFSLIFEQEHAAAFRRNFHAWGTRYEKRRRREVESHGFVTGKGALGATARLLRILWRRTTRSSSPERDLLSD
ncbi:MAG: glycosyltransferase family 10 [Arenicellales bacterium]